MDNSLSKQITEAKTELQDAITAHAVLANNYEAARQKAQQAVTMAFGRLATIIAIANKE